MKNPFSVVTGKRTFDKVSSIEDAYKDKKITIEDTEPEVPLMQEPVHMFIPAATAAVAASTATAAAAASTAAAAASTAAEED